MMRYALRQEKGKPAEHQNVRRAVARDPGGLIALLDGPYDEGESEFGESEFGESEFGEGALNLLRLLIADQDVHIRRAICDALAGLVEQSPDIALDLIICFKTAIALSTNGRGTPCVI